MIAKLLRLTSRRRRALTVAAAVVAASALGTAAAVVGFVAAVPTANREKFKKHADEAAAIFKEYGALSVVECWGDDVPEGKITSFPMAVQRKDDETVVFSWIVWPSKEARKAAWDKVMADPRMKPEGNPMPFDGKRMIYGGFEPIIER